MQEFTLLVYARGYSGDHVWREEKILLDLTSIESCKAAGVFETSNVRTKSGQDLRLKIPYEEFKKQCVK